MKEKMKMLVWTNWYKPKPGSPIGEFLQFQGKYEVLERKEANDKTFIAEIRYYKNDNRYSFYFCDMYNVENARNFFSETVSGAKARGNLYLLELGFSVKNILS